MREYKYGNILENIDTRIIAKYFLSENYLLGSLLKKYVSIFGYPDIGGAIRFRKVITRLDPQEEDKIIDIGCGRGFYSHQIAQSGAYVTGIDDGTLVEVAQEIGKNLSKSARIIRGDVTKIFEKINTEEKFDKAIAIEVLEHIQDDRTVFKEWCNLLKKNGKMILTVPLASEEDNRNYIADIINDPYGHKRAGYTLSMILDLCKDNNMEIKEFESYCNDNSYKIRMKFAFTYQRKKYLNILLKFPIWRLVWSMEKVSSNNTDGYHSIICTIIKK
jgi:2-polyprenyl-3-methyl-5-hydroxy-6-metoxy-1,4-benzoquinol methylase